MVPANALQRTFRLSYGGSCGTCFTVDVDNRQYVITARHVLPGIAGNVSVNIWHERAWKPLQCDVVGIAPGSIDIVVLAPPFPISPSLRLTPGTDEMYLSQDAYFLGFPFGLHSEVGAINSDLPIPLVKKACVSMFSFATGTEKYILLDGHNNPGFSGGPVIYTRPGDIHDVRVAGVISSYRFEWDKVYLGGKETPLSIQYNTGIIVAYSIAHALELIIANPIGAPLVTPGA